MKIEMKIEELEARRSLLQGREKNNSNICRKITRNINKLKKEIQKVNKLDQVYCTNCKFFKIKEISVDNLEPSCKYQEKCNLYDCEDSRSLVERPFYKEN